MRLRGCAVRGNRLTVVANRIPPLQPALMRTLRLLLAPEEEVQACMASARAARVSSARCFSAPPHDATPCTHCWSTERAAVGAFVRLLEDQLALVRSLRNKMGASGPEALCKRWCSAQERLVQRSLGDARQHRDTSVRAADD